MVYLNKGENHAQEKKIRGLCRPLVFCVWQLLLISVIAILWDRFTGWRGWSVDFILPFGVLSVQCSVPVIARVNRLKREEYLFYLVQALAF